MNREQARQYLAYAVDDAFSERTLNEVPDDARLVVFSAGFEPITVAVWSYLPETRVDDEDADALATDLLQERRWFADGHTQAPIFIL